jgi:hypothetical protein
MEGGWPSGRSAAWQKRVTISIHERLTMCPRSLAAIAALAALIPTPHVVGRQAPASAQIVWQFEAGG